MSIDRRTFLQAGLVLAGGMLAGCGGNAGSSSENGSGSSATAAGNAAAGSDASASDAAGAGKTLVACFSAQGHTRAVAQTVADELGADLFEIVPEEPYTSDDLDYNDAGSRVSREHDDEALRDVALTQAVPEAFADNGTVLVGYPIWWGTAAWPTNRFASDNDFSGKAVIPFCTSASSGIGRSGELLAQAAGTGDWQEGKRFSSGASEDEVRSWARSL